MKKALNKELKLVAKPNSVQKRLMFITGGFVSCEFLKIQNVLPKNIDLKNFFGQQWFQN